MLGVVDSPGAAGYRPQWRHDPAAAGGGVLMDMLHGTYLAGHLLGAPVTGMSAFVGTDTLDRRRRARSAVTMRWSHVQGRGWQLI